MLEVLLLALIFGGVVGAIAHTRGLPVATWFLYGFLIWPVALIHVFFAKPGSVSIAPGMGHRACPHCAEPIRGEARVCKHCGRDVVVAAPKPMTRADLQGKPSIGVERERRR